MRAATNKVGVLGVLFAGLLMVGVGPGCRGGHQEPRQDETARQTGSPGMVGPTTQVPGINANQEPHANAPRTVDEPGKTSDDEARGTPARGKGTPAAAQTSDKLAMAAAAPPLTTPQQALLAIHAANRMEVHAGQLAAKNGQAAVVKDYGQQLVRDHRQADAKVRQLASTLNVALPSATDPATLRQDLPQHHQQMLDSLQQAKGALFDRQFLAAMQQSHGEMAAQLESSLTTLDEPRLKALITALVPTLRQHEATAQRLQGEIAGAPPEAQGRRPAPRR